MRYEITRLILGQQHFVPSTHARFEEVRRAREGLLVALEIEEKCDILVENYREWEGEMLALATRHMLSGARTWSGSVAGLHLLNRRLSNLLSSCRLYVDHLMHSISTLYGADPANLTEVKKAIAEQYDSRLGYRVMEALRNWSQHRGLPIHELRYEATRDIEAGVWRFGTTPLVNGKQIESDGGFKTGVLAELGEKCSRDLKPLVRDYLEGLGQVHLRARNILSADVSDWDGVFESVTDEYRRVTSEDVSSLAIVAVVDDHSVLDSVSIFNDLIERRKDLSSKNLAIRLSGSFVSGEVWTPKA